MNADGRRWTRLRLGKTPARQDARTLRLAKYMPFAVLPTPPESVDYAAAVAVWPMFMNDQLGDCTIAGVGHAIQCWTANAGKPATPSDMDILTAYEQIGGYSPLAPWTDQGANELDVLNAWRSAGIAGHKIAAYAAVNRGNPTEVRQAMDLLGVLYLGVSLPDSVCQGDLLANPWDNTVTDAPNPNNGHAIVAVGYDADGLTVVTWGAIKKMNWGFFAAYCDECYAMVTTDWIEADGKSPSGFDVATLLADLDGMGMGSA